MSMMRYKAIHRRRQTRRPETTKLKRLEVPEFATYEDEAAFWDSLDTADFMEDDGAWFRFETRTKRAVRVAVLPDIAEALTQRDHDATTPASNL
jgi:hypothetical protein